jgi:hypothetical protein
MTLEYGERIDYYRIKGEGRKQRKVRSDRKLPSFEVLLELLAPPNRLTFKQVALIYDCSAPAVFFALNPEKRYTNSANYRRRRKARLTK